MKRILFFSIILLLFNIGNAQTNESSESLYKWKGSKTSFQTGYVVLKSNKILKGQVSLRGKSGAITGLTFIENGKDKEIKFPLSALNAYGLGTERQKPGSTKTLKTNQGPVCDNNPELFLWRDMGEQMGKKIENTKPRNGYVITTSGVKHEGELQLKRVDGTLSQIKMKSSSGKLKLDPVDIANYGLMMTIAEMTKDGKKNYNDEARNFHRGTVNLKNGTSQEGLIAFKKKEYINANKPGMGFKYMGIYYASSENATIKTYSNNELSYVSQEVNGTAVNYSPYEGGFVAANEMDKVKFTDDLKELNPGTLTLSTGKVLTGKIAKVDKSSLNYKSPEGIIKKYNAADVKRFDVKIENETRTVINLGGVLTEQLFSSDKFWAYINPTPTNIDVKKSNRAQSLSSAAGSVTGAIIMDADQKKNDYDFNLDSLVLNSSLEDLKKFQSSLWRVNGVNNSDEMQDKSDNKSAKKLDFSLSLAIAGKEMSESITFYHREIILIEKSSNKKYILFKEKKELKTQLEGLLMGCYTFLGMDKSEQKKYYDLDNFKTTVKLLNECY